MEDFAAFAQVAQAIEPDSKLRRVWPLTGGVSARVTALEVERPDGQTLKLVVRQYGEADLAANAQIAADEFRLLHVVHVAGIVVPAPYGFDQSGEIFATPYIVVDFVAGETDFAPWTSGMIAQFAELLARIHAVDAHDLQFLPQQAQRVAARLLERPAALDESLEEHRIRAALEAVWPLTSRNPIGLLHGDFWPGNILWQEGQIAAVIDWEDAALGDPLADVANARLELLWAFGLEAMTAFTDAYRAAAPIDLTDMPYWDLYAALRPMGKFTEWARDAAAAEEMSKKHRFFVKQAFEHLSETSFRPAGRS